MTNWNDSPNHNRAENPGGSAHSGSVSCGRSSTDPADLFFDFTRSLQTSMCIHRAVLILKEKSHSRFCAVACFNGGQFRKNLSLRLPGHSSLFQKVAEHRAVFTESYCDLFSGNTFERNLLIGDDSQSYAVVPLKYDGDVVGILGLSSIDPLTFVTLEAGALDEVVQIFAAQIGHAASVGS